MTKNLSSTKKLIIITGASSGIGEAAARVLSIDNTVVIVGRSERTETLARELGVEYFRADYAKLDSVRKLANDILSRYPKIDLLINNAGGAMNSLSKTEDGFEETFQINYLALFLLTERLLPRLIESHGAVINTSSAAHFGSHLKLESLDKAPLPLIAYGNAKLLDLIHAKELSRRFKDSGLSAVSFHPGVVNTNFAARSGGTFGLLANNIMKHILKSPAQGADTMIWLATNRNLWVEGAYYNNRNIGRESRIAKDSAKHRLIWDETVRILRLKDVKEK